MPMFLSGISTERTPAERKQTAGIGFRRHKFNKPQFQNQDDPPPPLIFAPPAQHGERTSMQAEGGAARYVTIRQKSDTRNIYALTLPPLVNPRDPTEMPDVHALLTSPLALASDFVRVSSSSHPNWGEPLMNLSIYLPVGPDRGPDPRLLFYNAECVPSTLYGLIGIPADMNSSLVQSLRENDRLQRDQAIDWSVLKWIGVAMGICAAFDICMYCLYKCKEKLVDVLADRAEEAEREAKAGMLGKIAKMIQKETHLPEPIIDYVVMPYLVEGWVPKTKTSASYISNFFSCCRKNPQQRTADASNLRTPLLPDGAYSVNFAR
jgi:hypothetical protein